MTLWMPGITMFRFGSIYTVSIIYFIPSTCSRFMASILMAYGEPGLLFIVSSNLSWYTINWIRIIEFVLDNILNVSSGNKARHCNIRGEQNRAIEPGLSSIASLIRLLFAIMNVILQNSSYLNKNKYSCYRMSILIFSLTFRQFSNQSFWMRCLLRFMNKIPDTDTSSFKNF